MERDNRHKIDTASEEFDSIKAGLEDALAYADGDSSRCTAHVVDVGTVDVPALRLKLGMSQDEFAETFGFKRATVRNYEQNRRNPVGPAAPLLVLINRAPDFVRRTLARSRAGPDE